MSKLNITPIRLKKMMCAYFVYTCMVAQKNLVAQTNTDLSDSVSLSDIKAYSESCYNSYYQHLIKCATPSDYLKLFRACSTVLSPDSRDFLNAKGSLL